MPSTKLKDGGYLLDVEPYAAPRQSRKDKWDPTLYVQLYRAYRDQLRWEAEQLGITKLAAPFSVVFVLPLPKWVPVKERELVAPGKPHLKKPDSDNLLKGFMDALEKADSHLHTQLVAKIWGMKGLILYWPKLLRPGESNIFWPSGEKQDLES